MAARNLVSRTIRVDLPIYEAAKEIAEEEGQDVSKVIRRLLEGYVKKHRR